MPGYNKYSLQSGQEETKPLAYITAANMVSPQASFEEMLSTPVFYQGEKMNCVEPDYTQYVDAKLIRRMSRIIKMGMAAAMKCIFESEIQMPDAIITGTAYGCLADTDTFLTRIVEFNEELLSPTAFIQSTHNTVAAQIALQLKCHNYNNTYVHRGASFESAMMDASCLLSEGDAQNVLVGSADEIIEKSHALLKRFGLFKTNGDSKTLLTSGTKGTMAGEGSAFLMLSNNKLSKAIARLDGMAVYHKPKENIADIIKSFLEDCSLNADEIDLIILGNNGDIVIDAHYNQVVKAVFSQNKLAGYKNYCGEYPTSSAFAVWMAAKMLEHGTKNNIPNSPKTILIYNNYKLQYPALYLLSAC